MSSYSISPKLKSNRVFILQKSELEKRFDPQFYKQEYIDNLDKIKRINHKRLGEIVKFSTENWNQKDFFENTFPYIEISEIDTLSGEIQNIIQVDKSEAASRAKMIVRENDIIISTTRPNRGAIALIKKEQDFSIASTGFSVIRTITNSDLNREFLFAILRQQIILKQFEQRSSGGNYPAITQEELCNVTIPVPNKETQEKIVRVFNHCFDQKIKNEAEAEKLLLSINTYLLNVLGINLPAPPENTLKNRIFTTQINFVTGSRLDPFFHQKQFDVLKNLKAKYPTKRIKEINEEIKTGLPVRKDYRIDDGNYPYYGANGIIGFMDEFTHNGLYLVIGQDGYIGNHYAVEGKFWGSNHNWVMKLKDGYDYNYVKSVLDVLKYDYLITGGVIPKLTKEALESIRIPIPSFDKQKEIAKHITDIRQQAQQLKDKTKELLKTASEEIENSLIG